MGRSFVFFCSAVVLISTVMIVEPATGFAPLLELLVPSQVNTFHRRQPHPTKESPSDHLRQLKQRTSFLVPSQIIRGCSKTVRSTKVDADLPLRNERINSTTTMKKAKSRRKPKRKRKEKTSASLADGCIREIGERVSTRTISHPFTGVDDDTSDDSILLIPSSVERPCRQAFLLEGNIPDVYWRSIPMQHLRQHPRFVPLPEDHSIRRIESLEDVRLFRQDSWQWDALHVGRCTTSQAVAALGFLENMAGELLQVPASWRRGGRGAFQRLSHPSPLRTLEDMNRVLVEQSPSLDAERSSDAVSTQSDTWIPDVESNSTRNQLSSSECTFVARYNHHVSRREMDRRKKVARQLSTRNSASALRLSWGNVQEATALLTALNYFAESDPGFIMKEVGMCGAGLSLNESSALLVGASPDALLCHGDGRIEALEVKNHCPFVTPFIKKGRSPSGASKRFRIGDRPLAEAGIFAQYIPQLMLEMLCLGEECRSAVMVRQSATKGALLLRVRRDDEWIDEMLHFLRRFQHEFVREGRVPPPNFFFLDEDKIEMKRYRRFLNKTMEIRNQAVEVIAHIPPECIQRAESNDVPLFLD